MAFQPSNREYMLIGALVLIAVGYLYYNSDSIGGAGEGDSELAQLATGQAPVVNMASLMREPEGYDAAGRSLFKYYTPPPPPRPKPPPPPPQKRIERPKPPPPKPRDTTPKAPPKPRPPAIDFTYLGLLGHKDSKIAVFEGKDGEIEQARMGDTLWNEFRVVDFKYEAIVMGYTDDRFADQTTELMQENK
ncbi:MAG: hypothetical protein GY716_09440 [bacterium]|nr:hypothetical protein [bacterium]